MNYYPFHIGDFRSGTFNMNRLARWIYRDMLDVYYDTEAALPLDLMLLCDLLGVDSDEERAIVERLLRLKFTRTDDGYTNAVCDRVIEDYRRKAAVAQVNGKRGGRPRKEKQTQDKPTGNPVGTHEKPTGFPLGSDPLSRRNPAETGSKANQEPITNNQEPIPKTTTDVVVCPEQKNCSRPVAQLQLVDGSMFEIDQGHIDRWAIAFPAVDVMQQLLQMGAWLMANSKNRKTRAGIQRFIVQWLGKEQNRAPRVAGPASLGAPPPRPPAKSFAQQEREEQMRRWEERTGRKHPELEAIRQAEAMHATGRASVVMGEVIEVEQKQLEG